VIAQVLNTDSYKICAKSKISVH